MNYSKRKFELYDKYEPAIRAIARANDVDVSEAMNMLEANVLKGANYPYVKAEEFKADWGLIAEEPSGTEPTEKLLDNEQ